MENYQIPIHGSQTQNVGHQLHSFQLNIEGISNDKSDYPIRLLHLHKIDILKLQEMYAVNECQLQTCRCIYYIAEYKLALVSIIAGTR